ncbi:NlpC/P60 family protein [Neobacillus drentensis]|uniref:C40 family peptidase n=1 Tax=Neobacillus drentensis TaxID=220684 RepID=UPI002FFED6E9
MIKKLFKYTVTAAILATTIQGTPTFASPATSATQKQISATKNQIDDFETKIQQLDNRISISIETSEKLTEQIKTQQEKIVETQAEIEEAKKSLDAHKEVYSERLKSIQSEGKQSIVTYAELLLSSGNLSEFFTRFSAISNIMESDNALLKGLNEKEQALKAAEEKLNNEYDQLKKSQDQLATEQRKIEEDKKEIEKALAVAENKLQNQQDQLAQQQAQEEAQRKAQEEAQRKAQEEARRQAQLAQQQHAQPAKRQSVSNKTSLSAPSVNVSNETTSATASNVIAIAKRYMGIPYVWGGTTPNGFDCSGLTSYVFRQVGINLPRVSRDQQSVGTKISPSQVQPGDLVFRGSPAYHVGIYIGGGQYIHAPQTGDVVKISTYNPAKFTSASRVLHP